MQAHTFLFSENGWVPNNPHLPVILYDADTTEKLEFANLVGMENLFEKNAWRPQWHSGVYAYHHYHTTAHEVLGIVAGSARLMLGGPNGREIAVERGQVLIIPAGVAHRCVEADEDFMAVGAYPMGQDWDLCKNAADQAMRDRIAHLPIPDSDPVGGRRGLLPRLWRH